MRSASVPVPADHRAATPARLYGGRAIVRLMHRSLLTLLRNPGALLPSVVFPVLVLFSWAGAYGRLPEIPGFPAKTALDWVLPFGLVQAAAFVAFPISVAAARDLQHGFADRLLMAPVPRWCLAAGPLAAAAVRAAATTALLLLCGLAFGTRVRGGSPGLLVVFLGTIATALIATELGLAFALVFRSLRAAPLILISVFLLVFLTPAQVPLDYETGWLHSIAAVNPMTQVVDVVRDAVAGPVPAGAAGSAALAIGAMAVALGLVCGVAVRAAR